MHTVLVVDDSKNIREFCRRELEKSGYRVLVAADGLEALNVCDTGPPDIVVLDVRMPGLNGLETIEQLFVRYTTIPVIFYTAHKDDLSLDFRSWRARACVVKSEDLRELKSAIARVLIQSDQRGRDSS